MHHSKSWKTFPDFLQDYIKKKLGPGWGNAEIAKPFSERHPLIQWYDAYVRYGRKMIKVPGEVTSTQINGVVACYLGVANALYLLEHNVELQERLLNRLRDPGNFQGAYYELIVASILIRAGFTLTLEDEAGRGPKHCEFAAVSGRTGTRYSVEAKMRAVKGRLGRTTADGGDDGDALGRLVPHLNAALAKPASGERLVFIDVNAEPAFDESGKQDWMDTAIKRLERYEGKELKDGLKAYVFVTNVAYHRQLDTVPTLAALPFGLGIPDFNRPGLITLIDAYRRKEKHIDAYIIGQSLEDALRFPVTFDGRLPSEAFDKANQRITIGETYSFEMDGRELVGTVTTANVSEHTKQMTIGVSELGGKNHYLIHRTMTDAELAEYKEYGSAYYGEAKSRSSQVKDPHELFEWLMAANKNVARDKILSWFSRNSRLAELVKLSDEELRLTYCEALVHAIEASKNSPDKDE